MRKNYRSASSPRKNTGESTRGTNSRNKETSKGELIDNNPRTSFSDNGVIKGGNAADFPSILDAHDTILVPKDVADMLRVTEAAVRDQIRKKKIPAHVHCDKYAILRSELMWTIRNTRCTMNISDMYKEAEEEESA